MKDVVTTMTKANSFNKEELIACGHGEIFGKNSPRLPVDNMLMIDRVVTINDNGGAFGKGEIVAELDINRISGSLAVTLLMTLLCQVVWDWMPCGNWLAFSLPGRRRG